MQEDPFEPSRKEICFCAAMMCSRAGLEVEQERTCFRKKLMPTYKHRSLSSTVSFSSPP